MKSTHPKSHSWMHIPTLTVALLLAVFIVCDNPAPLFGQGKAGQAKKKQDKNKQDKKDQDKKKQDKTKTKQKKKDEEELPELETLTLQTKDGVNLSVNYLGSNRGKKAPPIILVHDWEGSSKDFMSENGLARNLQTRGFAVIVPDLRGHGKSKSWAVGDKKLDVKKFRKTDFARMMEDVETCKRFLMKKNNEGKLNIELLTILATGKTAVIALDWSISDWSFSISGKGIKQGQDVKSILLLSPEKSWKGLSVARSLRAPVISGKSGAALPIFILTGNGSSTLSRQTKEIKNSLERTRDDDADDSLLVTVGNTDWQGADFSTSKKAQDMIHQFINLRVLSKAADLRWQNRSKQD